MMKWVNYTHPHRSNNPNPVEKTMGLGPEGKDGKKSSPERWLKDTSSLLDKNWIWLHLDVALNSEGGFHDDVQRKQAEDLDNIHAFT